MIGREQYDKSEFYINSSEAIKRMEEFKKQLEVINMCPKCRSLNIRSIYIAFNPGGTGGVYKTCDNCGHGWYV